MSDNIWRDEFMHHKLASEAEARERKQSDTPETDARVIEMTYRYANLYPHLCNAVDSDFARKLERERDETRLLLQRISDRMATDLNSDSEVASCSCNTKTPEIKHHKPGCKYRLIVERDEARKVCESAIADENKQLRKVADELAGSVKAEFGFDNWRLATYSQLPHVKQKEPKI